MELVSFQHDRTTCAEVNGDNLPDRPPHQGQESSGPVGRISVETARLRCTPARWHSPPFRSAHRLSLAFRAVDRADEDATLCSHARFRACCPGPLLTPCSRIVLVAVDATDAVRSVTHSRDARGARTRRLRASRYLRTPLRRSLRPLGPGTRLPCFVRLGDGRASPRSQPSGPHSSRP